MAYRRLDGDAVIDILSDVDSDVEIADSEDEIGEPVCDEFPNPDSDAEFPSSDSDKYNYTPCITPTLYTKHWQA